MAPLAGKSGFECPPAHLTHLKSRLRDVDVIYTIGWRAQERHFLRLLGVMRLDPPDVYALTKSESTAKIVADIVGQACGKVRMSGEIDRPGGPRRAADKSGGFSARVGIGGFNETLAQIAEAARERRAPRENELSERGF